MALQDQLNTIECGAEGVVGSGSLGCPIDPENIKHIYAVSSGTKITTTLDRALVRTMQKAGTLIPLLDAFDVTWTPEENQLETSPSLGIKSKGRTGLYELTAMFANGTHFQKVLKSMEGQNKWDIIVIDEDDNIFGTEGKNGEFKGFRTSMFAVNPYKFKSGAEGGKTSATMQFSRSNEFNEAMTGIMSETLDFIPSDMDGVNEIKLSLSGLTAASTGIVVKTVLDKGRTHFVGGLAVADFLVKVAGATVVPSGIVEDSDAKTYSLTVAALSADQSVEVVIYDTAGNSRRIEVGTSPDEVLYQSKEVTGVVTA